MIDLDELERLEKAAQSKPWATEDRVSQMFIDGPQGHVAAEPCNSNWENDAALIVALRNNAREIIDELRILQTIRRINPPKTESPCVYPTRRQE
jgi:hypothetical protein